jgi:hypothetical protein
MIDSIDMIFSICGQAKLPGANRNRLEARPARTIQDDLNAAIMANCIFIMSWLVAVKFSLFGSGWRKKIGWLNRF